MAQHVDWLRVRPNNISCGIAVLFACQTCVACGEPLGPWIRGLLWALPKNLPPLRLQLPVGYHVALDVLEGNCSGFDVGQLTLGHAVPLSAGFEVVLSAKKLHISCNVVVGATLSRHGAGVGSGPVFVAFELNHSSGVVLGLHVALDSDPALPLPVGAVLRGCEADLRLQRLTFKGQTWRSRTVATWLEFLKPALENEQRLQRFACGAAAELVGHRLSRQLADFAVATQRAGVLAPESVLPVPAAIPHAADLRAVLDSAFSRVLRRVAASGMSRRKVAMAWDLLSPAVPSLHSFRHETEFSMGKLTLTVDPPNCFVERPGADANATAQVIEAEALAANTTCTAPMNVTFVPLPGGSLQGGVLHVAGATSLSFSGVAIALSLLVGIDLRTSREYELDQWQHVNCILRALTSAPTLQGPAAALLDVRAKVGRLAVDLQERSGDRLAHDVLDALTGGFNAAADSVQPAITLLLRGKAIETLRNMSNAAIAARVAGPVFCPHSNFTLGVSTPLVNASEGFGAGFFLAGWLALAVPPISRALKGSRSFFRGRLLGGGDAMRIDASGGDVALPIVATATASRPAQSLGTWQPWYLYSRTTYEHGVPDTESSVLQRSVLAQTVPRWAQWSTCMFTASVIGIFLVSSTSLQVSLRARALAQPSTSGTHESSTLHDIYASSMATVLEDFWHSSCYPLAVFVALWSIAWPFAKLIAMLWCWNAPMQMQKCGRILFFLDKVGRLSLFDTFLFSTFLVGFRIRWTGRGGPCGDKCEFTLGAVPQVGFYMLVVGTIASLALGEFMLYCHWRRCMVDQPLRRDDQGPPPHRILAGVATPPFGREVASDIHSRAGAVSCASSTWRSFTFTARWGLALLSPGLTIAGITVKVFKYEWGGLIGAAKIVLDEPLQAQYSVLDVLWGLAIPYDTTITAKIEVAILFLAFGLFVVLTPLVRSILLAIRWTSPWMCRRCRIIPKIVGVVGAWCALDVFTLALFWSMLGGESFGIESFVHFLIEHGAAEPICGTMLERFQVRCVVFRARPLPGSAILVAAAVTQLATGMFPSLPLETP